VAIRRHNKLQKERKKRLNVVACPAISFKSGDVAESCRQVALAVKRFMEPPMEPLEKEDVLRLEESIVRPTTMTLEERAKDLEGLLWSRELGSIFFNNMRLGFFSFYFLYFAHKTLAFRVSRYL
jgi:hypothetical protein